MQRRLLTLLARVGLAFCVIAGATVLSLLIRRFQPAILPRTAPFLFLGTVLGCSWAGGYASGITSVLLVTFIGPLLGKRKIDPAQIDYYRLALLLLLSSAVSWIEAHRRHVEKELRAGVERKTAELKAAIDDLEREVQERKAAEDEVRRLNHLLELRVDERTRQLEVSNQELESFSYSVSHDLRAPLRSIDGFSRILLTSCFAKFDEEERSLFQRILAATGRMNELIDDLLNLARVTRTAMNITRVDLSGMAGRIASELSRESPEVLTQFIIEPGLTTSGDAGLIELAVHNLLENAWKFSSQSPAPCVEFGAITAGSERVLFVRDNGAGFDPAYKSKLFSPFQRLHRQEEFPGTGVGLATVLRIVHRHGGWIKAESQPGKGAVFMFTLSKEQVVAGELADPHLPEEPNPPVPRSETPSSSSTHSAIT